MNVKLISFSRMVDKNKNFLNDLEAISFKAAKTCVNKYEEEPNNAKVASNFLNSVVNKRRHESVTEHWSATFKIDGISRACSHQLVRHRIASYSQESQRYVKIFSEDNPLTSVVIPESIENDEEAMSIFSTVLTVCKEGYEKLLELKDLKGKPKIKKEDARSISPQCIKTSIIVTMNARSLRNFFKERLWNNKAQNEIRDLAKAMYEEVFELGNYFDKENC